MKKIILSIGIALSLLSYEIEMSQSFTKEISPNELGVSVSIFAKDKELKSVLNKLTDYSDFIKSFKSQSVVVKGGNFNTYPNYIYQNNKRIKVGYRGEVRFQIESKDSNKLNNFISQLSAKNSLNDVDMSISSMSWRVTKKDKQQTKEKLRIEAIYWGKKYAKQLSNTLGEVCSVKKINFGNVNDSIPPIVYARTGKNSETSIPTPVKRKQIYNINANFVFECK